MRWFGKRVMNGRIADLPLVMPASEPPGISRRQRQWALATGGLIALVKNGDKITIRVTRRYLVARCQRGKLPSLADEECVGRDEQRIGMLATKSSEGRVDLGDRTRIVDLDLQPQDWGGLLRVAHCVLRDGSVGRIDEHGETHGLGDQLMQQP